MKPGGSIAQLLRAFLFELLDPNGFVRLRFGPKTLQGSSGYALTYEQPEWTDPDTEAGAWFGRVAGPDTADAQLYAIGKGGETVDFANVLARATDAGGSRSKQATILADDTNGGIGRSAFVGCTSISLPAGSDSAEVLIGASRGALVAQVDVRAFPSLGLSEVLIVCDRMGAWTPLAYTAGVWGPFGGGWEGARYRRIGDMVFMEGLAANLVATPAPSIIGTLPVGFRPVQAHTYVTRDNAVATLNGVIDVLNTGAILCGVPHPALGTPVGFEICFAVSA